MRQTPLLDAMRSLRLIIRRIIIWFGAVSVVLVVIGAFLFWLVVPDMSGLCGNEVILESPSPDREKRLVVFERNCGATTDFSTQASVLSISAPLPNEKGNLFISDTGQGAAPAGPGGGPGVTVTWESARSVVLIYHPKARVFKSESDVGGVQVRYVTAP